MHVLKTETAPRYTRPAGMTSYLLASPRTSSAEHLTTTLAVIQLGAERTGFVAECPRQIAEGEPDSSKPVRVSTRLNVVCKRPPYCFVNAGASESSTKVDA